MFQRFRSRSERARHERTLRLFLFELTIVILGVLIAQWVANLAQQSTAASQMEDERSRARRELAEARGQLLAWQRAIPCLDQRVSEIMRGEVRAATSLARQAFPHPVYTPPDETSLLLVGKRYGLAERDTYKSLDSTISNLKSRSNAIIFAWGRFELINSTNGVVTEQDRTAARQAAADIKGLLGAVRLVVNQGLSRMRDLKLGKAERDGPQSCERLWRTGRIDGRAA